MGVVKNLAVNAYYLIYLTLDKWINPVYVILLILSGIGGWKLSERGKQWNKGFGKILFGLMTLLYLGISIWVYNGNINEHGILGNGLRYVYYVGMCLCGFCVGNRLRENLSYRKSETVSYENSFMRKVKNGIICLYVVGIVPLALISPYIFPKADDYSFGYHAHRAWEQTGSIWEVVKAAFVMIEEAYFDWQGTFSSIFFMAIQPAVFHERLYAIVPFIFIGIITLSGYFFMKTILIDWLEADSLLSRICIWGYLLLVIQRIPDSQSAFIWYNGAVHYIASHAALLCAIACTLKIYLNKAKATTVIGAVIFAVYVGGGNYVTAVGTLLICLTVLFGIAVTKNWKRCKGVVGICFVYFGALAVSLLAPGNFNKKANLGGYDIVTAFVMAFIKSLEHMLGEWMHWTTIVFILFMIPVLWHIVAKLNYKFRYPLLVVGYSWCYMASLFFSPLYTMATVDVGRFQNVMFMQWILLLLFDMGYIIGWIQRKYHIKSSDGIVKNKKWYLWSVGGIACVCMVLGSAGEPQKYTVVNAANTFMDPGLKNYSEEYWNMVEILDSEEKEVEIQDFSYIPQYFDVPLRHEGLRLFYSKDKVVVKKP